MSHTSGEEVFCCCWEVPWDEHQIYPHMHRFPSVTANAAVKTHQISLCWQSVIWPTQPFPACKKQNLWALCVTSPGSLPSLYLLSLLGHITLLNARFDRQHQGCWHTCSVCPSWSPATIHNHFTSLGYDIDPFPHGYSPAFSLKFNTGKASYLPEMHLKFSSVLWSKLQNWF